MHGPHPPQSFSAMWLNFDCLIFTLEAGLFFVMSRSLSARRWQQFYATVIVLLFIDFLWAAAEKFHGAAVPPEWLWFDIIAVVVLAAFIIVDWFFVPYDREKELNKYCYWAVSTIAILGLAFGYFYQLDYLIEY